MKPTYPSTDKLSARIKSWMFDAARHKNFLNLLVHESSFTAFAKDIDRIKDDIPDLDVSRLQINWSCSDIDVRVLASSRSNRTVGHHVTVDIVDTLFQTEKL